MILIVPRALIRRITSKEIKKPPPQISGSRTADHFPVETGKIFTAMDKIIDKIGNISYTRNTKGATGRRSDPEWMNYKK